MPSNLPPPRPADLEAIVARDRDVILRNLEITQGYHRLAHEVGRVVGTDGANWCVFAVWASKAAGRFIRLRDVRAELHRRLATLPSPLRWAMARIDRRLAKAELPCPSLRAYAEATLEATAREVMTGNLEVFSELAPLFLGFVDARGSGESEGEGRLEAFLARLRPGETAAGGQDPLRAAFVRLERARVESDPRRKAEHLLVANALTGLHEQERLQPHIAAALEAPVAEGIRRLARELARTLPGGFRMIMFRIFLAVAVPFVARAIAKRWRAAVTAALMDLHLPEGDLRLGEDVPLRADARPFPAALTSIADRELQGLLGRYRAGGDSLRGSAARDWADLPERIRYILFLFRSRHDDARLFGPPFSEAQVAAIGAGRLPDGEI